jgi:hypothetical protein
MALGPGEANDTLPTKTSCTTVRDLWVLSLRPADEGLQLTMPHRMYPLYGSLCFIRKYANTAALSSLIVSLDNYWLTLDATRLRGEKRTSASA